MGTLSKYFDWTEACVSGLAAEKGIDNSIPVAIKPTVIHTAQQCDKVREVVGPMRVNSLYRCLKLNTLLGSKDTSQHLKGEAMDFVPVACGNKADPGYREKLEAAWNKIHDAGIDYDQLILEKTWIHISFKMTGTNRRMKFIIP